MAFSRKTQATTDFARPTLGASVDRPAARQRQNTAPRVALAPRPAGPIKVRDRRSSFEAVRSFVLTPLDEVRALDALAFSDLPLATVIELELPGWAGPVWLRSTAGRGPHAIAPNDPVIDGPAWRALATAVASDRVRPRDFRALVEQLAQLPANEPDRDSVALTEIASWMDVITPSPCRLRLGQVLERLGARVFSVRIEGVDDEAANGPVMAHAG